jgi:hypothetical protein
MELLFALVNLNFTIIFHLLEFSINKSNVMMFQSYLIHFWIKNIHFTYNLSSNCQFNQQKDLLMNLHMLPMS